MYVSAQGGGGSLLEGAVPTLRLDPAVRAAVLAVAPPARAPRTQHAHALTGTHSEQYIIYRLRDYRLI